MRIRWGFLSTAGINDRVLPELAGAHGLEVVAIASRDRSRAERHAAEWGIERSHGGYEALLADPEVDAVYVNVPNALHTEWTLKALEAHKHVLCEKPMTPRAADVERIFHVARERDLLVMEAFMYRHNPQTRRLADLVDEGAIGRLRAIRATFRFAATDSADVRLSAQLEGGSLMDVGSYCVNVARLLAGEPERVHAEQVIGPTGVDVRMAGTLRFRDDVVAQCDCALSLPFRAELEVAGDDGSLYVRDPWLCRGPRIELQRESAVETIEVPVAPSYRLEFEHFSAAVRGDVAPLLGYDDALGQARTIEALFAAARQWRPVPFSASG